MAGRIEPTRDDIVRGLCGLANLRTCSESEEALEAVFGQGISLGWRKNTSAVESVELANLLKALRKVAGHLGPNAGRIEYAGLSRGPEQAIVIEPSTILGCYPVPGDRVDYLVGWVTHEALHRIEWSEHLWKILEPAFQKAAGPELVVFQKLVHAGEDIYVDQVADHTVFGLYTPQVRARKIEEAWRKVRPDKVSVDALLCHWSAATWAPGGTLTSPNTVSVTPLSPGQGASCGSVGSCAPGSEPPNTGGASPHSARVQPAHSGQSDPDHPATVGARESAARLTGGDRPAQFGTQLEPAYQAPLNRLSRLASELEEIGRTSEGATMRCERRAALYYEAWQDLRERLSAWKIVDKRLYWFPAKPEPSGSKPRPHPGQRVPEAGLDASLAREVEIELARNSTNLTPIIRQIVGVDEDSVAPTSRSDFQIPAHPLVDRVVVSRLRMIFQNYAAVKTVKSRGLESGRLDRRRLYRAPVTGRCFEFVDRLRDPEWNVTLLIDASGSMRGAKWRMVESTVANLHRALLGSRNHLEALAYYEMDGVCMISRLVKGRQLLSVPPHGLTASGQAIIAAAYFMPKGRRRNLLIHVTDGESNFGCDVRHGIEYCRRERIHLVTLACGYQHREALLLQYGKTLQFLDNFGQLSRAVERLLKWTFLYGVRRREQAGVEPGQPAHPLSGVMNERQTAPGTHC